MRYSFLPSLIFLCCFISSSKCMLFNGFEIRDLYTNDETFIADAEQWTATALRHGIPYSLCDGIYLVGGYDVLGVPDSFFGVQGYFFQRVYNDLPDHNIIYFTISLWLIDSWDPEPADYFQIQFDSALVEGWSFGFYNFTERLCGISDWADLQNMTIFGQVSHTGPSVTLRVISQLDGFAIDESLGFRDVHLIFAESPETNVKEVCGLSPIPLPSNQCDCLYGEYFDDLYTFGCLSCDVSCRSCFGPTAERCYECEVGYSFVNGECILCDESCAVCSGPNANQCVDCFQGMSLFGGAVCLSDCASIEVNETVSVCVSPCPSGELYDSDGQICVNPCGPIGGFLYWDGTCNSLCPLPLQEGVDNEHKCIFHCEFDEFLYWDGSCSAACDEPLSPSMFKNRRFCQSPCFQDTDYIYWNGTCESTCPSPFLNSSDGRANYCSLPCSEGDQPYWNGSSCLDSCSAPFRVREEDGILYCEYPCTSSEYLSWNGSCLDSCSAPYEICAIGPGMQFCSYLCKQYGDYFYPKEGQCLPTCEGRYTPEVQISLDGAWYVACISRIIGKQPPEGNNNDDSNNEYPRGPLYFPITAIKVASEKAVGVFIALDILVSLLRDSHVMILILVIKILNFMRYLDIRIPPQLMQEIQTSDHNYYFLNFGPSMSEEVRAKFTKSPLPLVFERTGLHSRFLVNFFKPITSFLIMLGLIVTIGVLRKFLQRRGYILIKMLVRRVEIFVRWNLVVLLVICNIDQITLYGILEWKTLTTDSGRDSISLLISFGMAVLSLAVFVAPFYLLDRIYRVRFKVLSNQANEAYFNLLKKIEGFRILWKNFKDSSGSQKAFLPLYMVRICLIYVIIGLLHDRPMLQMVLIFSISLGMLTFMLIVKPFMKILDLIQSLIYEICMLISVGSLLILSIFDFSRVMPDQVWLFLGDCIQFCNILISLTAVVFFIVRFCLESQRVWKFYKMTPKPVGFVDFAILFLKEDDPIVQELQRNKRTSGRLDLTNIEREIERRNFERYQINFGQSESNNKEVEPSFIPRKGELRIRRSLFGVKISSSDSENSPFKTSNSSTFDELQSPNCVSTKKIFEQGQGENEERRESEEKTPVKRRFLWKGLETIKEMDSMEASEIKNVLHTKRLGGVIQDSLKGDLSFLNAVNKRLSSETMMQKIEEAEIIKEETDLVKKKLTMKEENASKEEALFY